jgi:hypothetical protein
MSDTLTIYGWTPTEIAWRQQAACLDFVDTFFPERPNRYTRAAAIRICDTCRVVKECDAYADATEEKSGVWGGKNRTKLSRL